MITPEQIKQDKQIKTYIERADDTLQALGYTEHSFAHVTRVAHFAQKILEELGYDERTCQLAWIAGYMHDIGNVINRIDHAQSGAVMAFRILDKLGMSADEIATVCSAIGNHDESTAFPVNAVAAALILADKTDVRRTRVRNRDKASFDIHDRVNYAVEKAATTLNAQEKAVVLTLTLDTEMSAVMDYFEIFLAVPQGGRKAGPFVPPCGERAGRYVTFQQANRPAVQCFLHGGAVFCLAGQKNLHSPLDK